MRIRFLILSFLFISSFVHASEEIPISSTIKEVKVFLNGAQVSRTASQKIEIGSSTLVFTGLSQQLDPQSIQVSGKGGFTILSVNHKINYLAESPKKAEIGDLQKRIKKLEHDYVTERGLQQVWENEEQLLLKNSAIGGQQSGVSLTQLQGINDYTRERLRVVKIEWQKQNDKLTELHEEAEKLRQQLAQLQALAPRPTSEIMVEIDAPAAVSARFTLSYFARNAGWTPAYDLRAEDAGKDIELLMKAEIVNSTGEDWEKVNLSLSSGNPTMGGNMPTLNPWILQQPIVLQRLQQGNRSRPRNRITEDAPAPNMGGVQQMDADLGFEEMASSFQLENTTVYRTTTVEFVVNAPFSVPTDGLAHTVGVDTHTIPASYRHFCTPKLDKDAFLYARTTGWEDLNLLPGHANVFFEGTFVGRSYLDMSQPEDTLEISLGRDKGVVVERVKRKGFSDKPTIGGKRTVTIGWDLNVRNTKNTTVDLEIRDQYPISPRSEVEVKLVDSDGAAVDKDKGSLTWNMSLAAKEKKEIKFTYQVKHPKGEPVPLE